MYTPVTPLLCMRPGFLSFQRQLFLPCASPDNKRWLSRPLPASVTRCCLFSLGIGAFPAPVLSSVCVGRAPARNRGGTFSPSFPFPFCLRFCYKQSLS